MADETLGGSRENFGDLGSAEQSGAKRDAVTLVSSKADAVSDDLRTGERETASPPATPPQANKSPAGGNESLFSITVEDVYDGPLDLLLDLLRKQDINIYDIPIARITAQYLAYVERIKHLDINVAAEFIYMASVLIQIKSRMLLPRDPGAPPGEDDDPRRELVERLLEHEKFKNAAQMLLQKQHIEEAVWSNPALREFAGDPGTEAELAADIVDLARTFRQILKRTREEPVLLVDEEAVTVGQMVDFIRRRLLFEDHPVALRRLLQHTHSQAALICCFLGLLELVRLQAIVLRQDRACGEILLKKHLMFDTVFADSVAVRDDWR